ncbi:hypothetical protein [Trueperella bernardiae]|uniref:hypothetical protein n=1 Tax=Trueperella bernardiae TaxID=59561 RepID=UPI000837F9D5|nr:hypothetical protein [Trueperella bernardiae]OCW60009.1 hypothetical protein AKG36_06765 [Trueperella bernardiae]
MRERWLFDLTDREGAPVRRLENVVSASLVGNVNRQIRWDGRLELGAESGVDWAAVRVAVSYQRDNGAPEPFGVYVPMLDTQTRVEGGREQVSEIVNLYDRTSIPAGDLIADTYSLTAGDTVTSLVREIIETTGERGVSITPLGERTRTDLVWDPGTSKLRIINDLLDAAGFFALYTNYSGQYVLEPYRVPALRPVVAAYVPGGRDLYTPTVETTFPDRPVNRVVLRSRGDGEKPDLLAVAENTKDFQATGVWRTSFTDDVEATSQVVLDQMAARRLAEAGQATWTRTRTTEINPNIGLNSVVSGEGGGREVVEEISVQCQPGALMQVRTREVYGG